MSVQQIDEEANQPRASISDLANTLETTSLNDVLVKELLHNESMSLETFRDTNALAGSNKRTLPYPYHPTSNWTEGWLLSLITKDQESVFKPVPVSYRVDRSSYIGSGQNMDCYKAELLLNNQAHCVVAKQCSTPAPLSHYQCQAQLYFHADAAIQEFKTNVLSNKRFNQKEKELVESLRIVKRWVVQPVGTEDTHLMDSSNCSEFWLFEEELIGKFEKYISNSDFEVQNNRSCLHAMLHALVHHNLNQNAGRSFICDLQGVGCILTDPAVNDLDKSFGSGNLNSEGLALLLSQHKENTWCIRLGLGSIKKWECVLNIVIFTWSNGSKPTTRSASQPAHTSHPLKRIYKCSICKVPGHCSDKCPTVKLSNAANEIPGILSNVANAIQDFDSPLFSSKSDRDGSNSDCCKSEDKRDLCPFCDEPLPTEPSKKLLRLKAILFALPNITKRSGHPEAMYLPFPQTADFCELHHAECEVIPFGIGEGWPTSINFELLEGRIQKHQNHLVQIINQKTSSFFLDEAQTKLKQQGRKIFGLAGEFDGFHVEQPGYYGQRGYEVMINTLTKMFLSNSLGVALNATTAAPFPPDYFLRRVLVPELAMLLIAEDLDLPFGDPKVKITLEASRRFGNVLQSISDKGAEDDNTSWV